MSLVRRVRPQFCGLIRWVFSLLYFLCMNNENDEQLDTGEIIEDDVLDVIVPERESDDEVYQ